MSDSIENDEKFVRLMKRLVCEREQVRASRQVIWDLNGCDLIPNDLSAKLEDINRDLKVKSETTLKHIFKYIDRRVERAVAEDRKVKEVDKLKELYRKFDKDRNEKLRLDSNGSCIFNFKELPLHLFDDLNRLLIQEIIKIDPALLMIKDHSLGFEGLFIESVLELEERTIVVFFRFDGMRLEIRFKSDNGLFEISLPEIAKYFSDEINKIARDKYAPE